jgi:lysophospholipase L1-like esterase
VITFAEHCRARGARSLATFGDSITAGSAASLPERRWSNLLAAAIGAAILRNKGISGTVMQQSPMADGLPRPDNGRGRFERDLLGEARADVLAILYGFNDARYIDAPASFHAEHFVRDYREVLAGLFAAGFRPADICIGSPPHLRTRQRAHAHRGRRQPRLRGSRPSERQGPRQDRRHLRRGDALGRSMKSKTE